MHTEHAPSSLGPLEIVAPWQVFLAGMTAVGMCVTQANKLDDVGLILLIVAVPVMSATFASHLFAKGSATRGWGALVGGALLQALLGALVTGLLNEASAAFFAAFAALLFSTFVYVLASPAFFIALSLGRRTERDRGDTMLVWGGVWSAALHAVYLLMVWDHADLLPFWVALLGFVASLAAVAVGCVRAQNRRTFARLARHGRVPGYRVRVPPSLEELRGLPALYAVEGAQRGVLERTTVSFDGTAYRGGLVGTPVALVAISG